MLGAGLAWSMQACHDTIPSRRENSTVSGTRIGLLASSRLLSRSASLSAPRP